MTKDKNNNTTTQTSSKLTFGKKKLTLGARKTVSSAKTNPSLVLEVKSGKVNYDSNLSLDNFSNNKDVEIVKDQNAHEHTLSILHKAHQNRTSSEEKISGFIDLSQLNRASDDQSEVEEEKSDTQSDDKQDDKVVDVNKNSQDLTKDDNDKVNNTENTTSSDSNTINKHHKQDKTTITDSDVDDDVSSSKDYDKKSRAKTKSKILEPRKLNKSDMLNLLDEDFVSKEQKQPSIAAINRAKLKHKRNQNKLANVEKTKIYREVILSNDQDIIVSELANKMSERTVDIVRELMQMGVIVKASDVIDIDTAQIIVEHLGHKFKIEDKSDIENVLSYDDDPANLVTRPPVVTIMGHVDHGKTSLLDALRSTDVAQGEAGGITQHIGAYTVTMSDNRMITFIDTPGHEAFTEMRARGTHVTDIVVIVVAADDGIKTQTIEAINHAKAAKVPIIVAINKIDKPEANIENTKNELFSHELVPEEHGGDVIVVPVSALAKKNLDKLEEAILLVAEMQELKANPDCVASGVVIESKLDKFSGVAATLLIQRGTLRKGDVIVAGNTYGRVKQIRDDHGLEQEYCTLSHAVEIAGLNEAPIAGDRFDVVETDKQAREIAEYRSRKTKASSNKVDRNTIFEIALGKNKRKILNLIIKADTQGAIQVIKTSIDKIVHDEVTTNIIHSGVGAISDADIALANTTGAMVIGFNVRMVRGSKSVSDISDIDVRYYSVIYNLIDDIKLIMSGMLDPIIRENYTGSVVVREVFNITKIGKIAGSYVTKGLIKINSRVRLTRDGVVLYEGKLKTLKRFKDDVKEVREGYECGIALEKHEDIRVGDNIEVYEVVEEEQKVL